VELSISIDPIPVQHLDGSTFKESLDNETPFTRHIIMLDLTNGTVVALVDLFKLLVYPLVAPSGPHTRQVVDVSNAHVVQPGKFMTMADGVLVDEVGKSVQRVHKNAEKGRMARKLIVPHR
jgi:hypothetical protein